MAEVILLDAGPLVALMDHREEHHAWAKSAFAPLHLPLMTCQGALTEAFHLLRDQPSALAKLTRHVQVGHFVDALDFNAQASRIAALMERYANVPMSFTDACLVAMSEAPSPSRILTLDSDFQIYRRQDGGPLALIAPFAA